MAIDASILTTGFKTPQAPKSLDEIYAEQDKLEQARLKRDAIIQQAKDDAAVKAAFGAHSSPDGGIDFDGVLSDLSGKISPSAFQALQKQIDDHRNTASLSLERDLKNQKTKLDAGISMLNMAHDASSYTALRPSIVALDPVLDKALPPEWDDQTPDLIRKVSQGAMTEKERVDAKHTAAQDLIESLKFARGTPEALDKARISLATWLSSATSPEEYARDLTAAPQIGYPQEIVAMFQGKTAEQARQMAITPEKQAELAGQQASRDRQQAALEETERHNRAMEERMARVAAGTGSQDDAKAIADSIVAGDQPPTLTGLYRFAAPVRAELARQHYDLTRATEDWTATQKYLTTLNGTQQTRLRQAVSFVTESVPLIRSLVTQWDSMGLPLLSSANLALVAKGGKGQEAQSLAVRLKGQIADLQSELGTVYKGGNSSTDESLRLASENLQADWSKKAALDALDQIEQNMRFRNNSIKNTGPIGGRQENPYSPEQPGLTVSFADLEAVAKLKGTSVEEQVKRYEAGGYKVIR